MYPHFLSTISSCTLASLTDQEIQDELDHLALRAIAKFKFPKVKLDYLYDSTIEQDGSAAKGGTKSKGYYFIYDVTMQEIRVILSWMKMYWLEYQLSRERNYVNAYADKDVKVFSTGNLLSSIKGALDEAYKLAAKDEEDYSRVNKQGRPAIGDVNTDEFI